MKVGRSGAERQPAGGSAPDGGDRARRQRLFATTAVVFADCVVSFAIAMLVKAGGSTFSSHLDDVVELAAAAAAGAVCLVVAARSSGELRLAWRFIGASAVCWAIGETIWTWYDLVLGVAVPFPSWADAGFLLAVPLAATGVLLFPSAPSSSVSRARTVLDGIIVAGSLLFVSWTTALGAVYRTGTGGLFSQAIGLAYPIGDVIIATLALVVLSRNTGSRRTSLALIVAGLLCLAVADSSFAYLTQAGTFGEGSAIDTGWVAGYLLIALAALWPDDAGPELEALPGDLEASFDEAPPDPGAGTERPPPTPVGTGLFGPSTWQAVLPYFFLGIAVVAAIVTRVTTGPLDRFLLLDFLVLIAAVLVRQVLMISENQALNRQLEAAVATLWAHERELVHNAFHDPLTGLANRVLFADRVGHALAHSGRNDRNVAVLLCDLDSFKDVNDTLGHSSGDEVLVAVAGRLRSCVRPSDTVARIGGDEFAVLLDEARDDEEIAAVAQRICGQMRQAFVVQGREFIVHASVGIATGRAPTESSEALLRDADIALYSVKRAGGDDFTFFEQRLGSAHGDRLGLQAELAAALANDEFYIEYQPIIELGTGTVAGVEALLRWRHPRLGVLVPASFLPLAETTGVIVQVGGWVVGEAVARVGAWRRALGPGSTLWISVNVSARQLAGSDLVAVVARTLAESGIDPAALHLELTETSLIEQVDWSLQLLHELKSLGVKLDIDDFGTGYSSLAYLRRLPIDAVKLDRVFVEALDGEGRDAVIVGSIVELAHALGLVAVAEGVQTPSQLAALRELGCDFGQGLTWAMPLEDEAVEAWLLDHA